MIVSKEGVIGGYLLSGLVEKVGLDCDLKVKSFLKNKKLFVEEDILPREVFQRFRAKVRRYDMESLCGAYSKCKEVIEREELEAEGYE